MKRVLYYRPDEEGRLDLFWTDTSLKPGIGRFQTRAFDTSKGLWYTRNRQGVWTEDPDYQPIFSPDGVADWFVRLLAAALNPAVHQPFILPAERVPENLGQKKEEVLPAPPSPPPAPAMARTDLDDAEIERRFLYHAPNEITRDQHDEIRAETLKFAFYLASVLPSGRERSLAITALEEASFWSHAAIARQSGG